MKTTVAQHKVHPPAGARPGTLVIPDDAVQPRIGIINYDQTSIEDSELESADDLESLRSPRPQTWIDVQGLGSEKMLRSFGEIFSIHPLALEDIVHLPQRPKTEVYEENQFFTTRMVRLNEDGSLDIEQVSMFLGEGWLITFQERYGDVLDPVRQRLRRGGGVIRELGTDYLCYAIIDTIIDQYFPVVERIGDRLEELEEIVLESPGDWALAEINRLRRDLLIIRRAVWPQREAVSTLLRDGSPFVDP
ncbi:MAG: CorA family divalent cation transporter, partial [Thermoanaerobaculia bacterium]|nr:CorA family divalent cation transporter [Thermoanaerobaculia bacterium]